MLQAKWSSFDAPTLGAFKKNMVGRSSEVTFTDAFEKQEAVRQCNCKTADVENALSKFTWAKEAQKKIEKLTSEMDRFIRYGLNAKLKFLYFICFSNLCIMIRYAFKFGIILLPFMNK